MSTPFPLSLLLPALLLGACGTPDAPAGAAPAADVVAIGQVQGRGEASPLLDREVAIEGVVTGGERLGGWFVQDAGDGDPATSDAIFVAADPAWTLRPGERVRVRGRVVEHGEPGRGTLTSLQPRAIERLGQGEVAPVVLRQAPDDWERLEGMRVRIEAPLVVAGQHELTRYGVLHASFGERPRTPTDIAAPGPDAQRVAADNARRSLLLDDASAAQRPRRVWYLDGATPRSGSLVRGAEGIVDQRWGAWRLQLTARPEIAPAPRPPAPVVPGGVRLAVFNLGNLFNGDGQGGGFPTPRGARTEVQWQAQLARAVATLRALDPHVAALMELENDGDGPESAVAQLVDALNAGGGDWRFVATGQGPGTDAIRVGLLYRASRLRPEGAPATLTTGPFSRRSRAPLAQAFVPQAGGRDAGPAFVVVANHFKSKGCGEAKGAEADQGDGQACWNPTRIESARLVDQWLATDPTGTGSDLAAFVGDLNAYSQEAPLRYLRGQGWSDALPPTAASPHSFVFDGQAGRLDHALLSPALARRLAGATVWHSNADEPLSAARGDGAGEPWRSSDHDPLLLGLDL